jgi:hypothetical protein
MALVIRLRADSAGRPSTSDSAAAADEAALAAQTRASVGRPLGPHIETASAERILRRQFGPVVLVKRRILGYRQQAPREPTVHFCWDVADD